MGAVSFVHEAKGFNVEECFRGLVESAIHECGHDGYNGTISTCSLGVLRKKFDKPTKTNIKKAMDLVREKEGGYKRQADYIDLGIEEYQVITFKKVNNKKPPTYKLSYVVKKESGWMEYEAVKDFENKKIADDYAIGLSIKNPNENYITSKEYVLVKGESQVTSIEKEVKIYKSKPNLKPMPNRLIIPVHRYIFYGFAAC